MLIKMGLNAWLRPQMHNACTAPCQEHQWPSCTAPDLLQARILLLVLIRRHWQMHGERLREFFTTTGSLEPQLTMQARLLRCGFALNCLWSGALPMTYVPLPLNCRRSSLRGRQMELARPCPCTAFLNS